MVTAERVWPNVLVRKRIVRLLQSTIDAGFHAYDGVSLARRVSFCQSQFTASRRTRAPCPLQRAIRLRPTGPQRRLDALGFRRECPASRSGGRNASGLSCVTTSQDVLALRLKLRMLSIFGTTGKWWR